VYGPGSVSSPFADHAWDNQPFAALLVAAYVKAVGPTSGNPFLCSCRILSLRKALSFQNISTEGLVYNDDVRPNCTYGFTDTVRKTGNLLFTSLVMYDAAMRLHALLLEAECEDPAWYSAIASGIQEGLGTLYNPSTGMYYAASVGCRQIDVWGSLYAVHLNISTPAASLRIVNFIAANASKIFQRGQVRHLVDPEVWEQCIAGPCPAPGTYQNGAYWATPLAWSLPALSRYGQQALAQSLLNDTLTDFIANGVNECVDGNYAGVKDYVASATNVYGARKYLLSQK